MTTRLFNSSSINDFRASASKRILASAILFSAFFAGPEHVCQAFTLGYSAGYLTDPFQAIEVNKTIEAAQQAGIKTLPVPAFWIDSVYGAIILLSLVLARVASGAQDT